MSLLSSILTPALIVVIYQRLGRFASKHLVDHIVFILISSLEIVPWEIRHILLWRAPITLILILILVLILVVTLLLLRSSLTPSKIKEIIYSIIWSLLVLLLASVVISKVPVGVRIINQSLFIIILCLLVIPCVETRVFVLIVRLVLASPVVLI